MSSTVSNEHYVPILRLKAAEIQALSKLGGFAKKNITPLFELLPSTFAPQEKKTSVRGLKKIAPEELLKRRLEELNGALPDQSLFLDFRYLDKNLVASDGADLWRHTVDQARDLKLHVIPVTGFYGKGVDHQQIVSETVGELGNGVCIRLFVQDLQRKPFPEQLECLLHLLKANANSVDIIVDLELIDSSTPEIRHLISGLPRLHEWRTLIVVGGSFPKDLSPFKPNDTYIIPRKEWKNWQKQIIDASALKRTPTYGDYTVQHPVYYEPVSNPHVSASIRYTASDYWIVYRGEWIGKAGGGGSGQYPAHAQLLVEREEYMKADFCFADAFIMKKALDGKKPGSVKDWLVVAINHHLAFAVHQLSKSKASAEPEIAIVQPVSDHQSQEQNYS